MRFPYFLALLLTVVGSGVYFYTQIILPCPTLQTYSLGDIDERFNLSSEEALEVIDEAVSIWEEQTGAELFAAVPEDGDITFNFVFDERQSMEIAENTFAAELAEGKSANEAFTVAYDQLVAKYEAAIASYEAKKSTYETAQDKYNAKVAAYNAAGGAPEPEYQRLEEERKKLDRQAENLETEAASLNKYVTDINELASKGKEMIANYNSQVATYNSQFSEGHEFVQGDYKTGIINIYTFEDEKELKAVLLHELGHSLSLDHIDDKDSIMYYLMENQKENPQLTPYDLEEYVRVCENRPWWQKIILLIQTI